MTADLKFNQFENTYLDGSGLTTSPFLKKIYFFCPGNTQQITNITIGTINENKNELKFLFILTNTKTKTKSHIPTKIQLTISDRML